jgi:hypothetical protein
VASTPQTINVAVGAGATDLFTAFVAAASRGMLVALHFCNTTTADITVDVWHRDAGNTTSRFLMDDETVPAKGTLNWSGMVTLAAAGEKIRAQASGAGVDCLGTVIENA